MQNMFIFVFIEHFPKLQKNKQRLKTFVFTTIQSE